MNLVLWHPTMNHHFVALDRALSRHPDVALHTVVGRRRDAFRARQGWVTPEADGLSTESLDRPDWILHARRILARHGDAVHLFNMLFADGRFLPLAAWAARTGHRVALMTEPYSEVAEGYFGAEARWKSEALLRVRPPLYRLAAHLLGERVAPIFAVSNRAAAQLARAGFAAAALRPFGYFVPPAGVDVPSPTWQGELRAAYVGTLSRIKGLDVAVRAVELANDEGTRCRLDVFGPGDPAPFLDGARASSYRGTIPLGHAPAEMAKHHVLVVPSRHDGWGVVVNEALQAGVPVLASRGVGAAELVEASGAGLVFAPDDPEALAAALREAADPTRLAVWRERARGYASRLSPDNAARYVHDCLLADARSEPAPSPPWRS